MVLKTCGQLVSDYEISEVYKLNLIRELEDCQVHYFKGHYNLFVRLIEETWKKDREKSVSKLELMIEKMIEYYDKEQCIFLYELASEYNK